MNKGLRTKKTLIWIVLLLLLILGAQYLLAQAQPKEYPIYASNSPSPTGVKAFYTYLSNNYELVERWTESPSKLTNHSKAQTLIMVEPYFIPNSTDIQNYEQFMESGNTILLFKSNPKGMFELGTEIVESEDLLVVDRNDIEHQVEHPISVRLQPLDQDEVLLSDEMGPIALKRSFGKGQLIVANAPQWIMNKEIVTNDHLPLILDLFDEVEGEVFLFDEYIHGEKNAATIFTVYPQWFLLFIFQAVLLASLWLWSRGKRFGTIFISREESVRFSDEAINALAAWYMKGKRYNDALLIQADYVKTLIQERWAVPAYQEWSELIVYFERKDLKMPKAKLVSWLTDLTSILKKEQISKQEFLLWSKRLEEIRKEVEAR